MLTICKIKRSLKQNKRYIYLTDFLQTNRTKCEVICSHLLKWGIIFQHYIPRYLLLNLYHALITPYLNFGICAWGSVHRPTSISYLFRKNVHCVWFILLNPETMQSLFYWIKLPFFTIFVLSIIKLFNVWRPC